MGYGEIIVCSHCIGYVQDIDLSPCACFVYRTGYKKYKVTLYWDCTSILIIMIVEDALTIEKDTVLIDTS